MKQKFCSVALRFLLLHFLSIASIFISPVFGQTRSEKPRKETPQQKFAFESGVSFKYFSTIGLDSLCSAFASVNEVILTLDTTREAELPGISEKIYFYQQFMDQYPMEGAYVMAVEQDGGFLISGKLWDTSASLDNNTLMTASEVELKSKDTWHDKADLKCKELSLTWTMDDRQQWHLTYSFIAESMSTFFFKRVYMDAITGEILDEWSLLQDSNVEGLGLTRYNGVKNFNCEGTGSDYRLNDIVRGIYTYDGNGQDAGTLLNDLLDNNVLDNGQPFTSLEPVFDQTPRLTYLQLDYITVPLWDPGTFDDQNPDIYFQVKNAQSQVVYESGYYIDDATNLQFTVPSVLINNNGYTIYFYDYDPISADDLLFSIPLRNNGGRQDYTAAGVSLFLNTTTTGQLDAHWGMGEVYDFYSTHFGRDSYDNQGSPIYQFLTLDTNYFSASGYPNNAFALSSPYNVMIYGQGDGVNFGPFVSHDVMGHEYTHMVIDNNGSGGLVYQGESGALNEAIADIFGVLIEEESQGSMDWLVGEDIIINPAYGSAFRSFSNPNNFGQPDTYGGQFWVDTNSDADYGGVHTNSGVLNYWFYLLVQGGVGENDIGSNFTVSSIGTGDARDLVYYTLVNLPSNNLSYIGFRDVTLSIGALLFGTTSDQMLQIKRAWYAVGLGPNPDAYCSPLTTLTASSDVITDGSGLADYKENSECYWLIQPEGNPNRIQINISTLSTELNYDYIYVFDGATVDSPSLGVYSGTVGNLQLESTQGEVLVVFVSDAYIQAAGWTLEYTAIYEGCEDVSACNYNPLVNVPNGSCIYPLEVYLDCDGLCLNDADNDGICDEIEILGCTDSSASNYNPAATQDDGSCAQVFTCNITAPTTTLCEGESVTLSVNTTGGTGASSQLPANLQQGLVAYYPFNGNANDESGNGNNGVVNGATLTEDRFGNAGSAYGFDGVDDFINCGVGFLNDAMSATISIWFRTGNLSGVTKNLCNKRRQPYGDGWGIMMANDDVCGFLNREPYTYSQNGYNTCANFLPFEWVNIVVVNNNSVLSIYKNGELNDTKILTVGPIVAGMPMYIGKGFDLDIGGGNRAFDGSLDDVFMYNRALSPAEIQQLFTAQSHAWSNNATTPTITVSPAENTTYTCTVTQGNQTCTASVDITVNPNITNAISANIIEGETYTLGTQTLTTAGTYTEVFTSDNGCDSTVTLTLAVEPLLICNITAPTTTLCEGESVTLSVNTTGGAVASFQLPANLQQGLVAYYPFNGNANDESGNGNHGVVNGATLASDRIGNVNSSYSWGSLFDKITVPSNSMLQLTESFTISVWINPSSIVTSPFDSYYSIVQKWGSFNDASFIVCLNLEGIPKAVVHDGNNHEILGNSVLTPGTWNLITYSHQNNIGRLYVNGVMENSMDGIPNPILNNNDMVFGSNDSYNLGWIGNDFIGDIDDIAIYNRALTPSEIQQLYSAQSYAWSNNSTTPTITVSPTQLTTYSCTVTTDIQSCTDSITITVNPLLTWYADADADGFGNPDDVVQDCNQPLGYIADNTDCNDEDATTYPGASEICDNNRDENCDGVDSLCFVPILGCTDINACNFNPEANTEDGSCVLPQPETCNGLDDNCNGQIDEGFSAAAINAVSATTALYPVCSGNSIRSANLNNGANSAVIEGSGNDLWYSFTAQFNTFRAGLSAALGDNEVRLYTMAPGGCLELIETEHEITTGNQVLLSDQLTVGQTYYVAVHNISGSMNHSAKICFNHLTGSTCDHYYSNNTGIYTSVCNSFKAQYRANAVAYTFDILSVTQNNVNQNITPWSYTTTSASTVVARLGTLLPANQGTSPMVYTLKVPVLYSLFDAAGNFENLFAQATTTCVITLNAEPTIALRSSDRCPITKSLTSTIAPDRTVCGAMRYDWEFTEVLPNPGTAQVVQGGNYTTVFFLSNVPGITVGKTYSVRVRPVHSSGITGNWGAAQCLRVGSTGMVMQSENESGSVENIESRVSSISVYPNPTASGSFVLQYNGPRRGELIFAPDATTESIFVPDSTTELIFAQELVMMDITGKVVFKTNVVLNGNIAEIHFGDLESGLYLIDFGGERTRVQVIK